MTARLHAVEDGPADASVLVLAPSLGTDIGLFDPQIADPPSWAVRARQVREQGTEILVPSRTGTWFTAEWAEKEPAAAERLLTMLRATPAEGYATCCEAIGAYDVRDRLGDIPAPTLVVAGTEDPATTVDMVRLLADGIPDSEFLAVPGAAHLAQRHPPAGGERRAARPLRREGGRPWTRSFPARRRPSPTSLTARCWRWAGSGCAVCRSS
jgi:pimeloyl-ACP methyl ester carboxylesterase